MCQLGQKALGSELTGGVEAGGVRVHVERVDPDGCLLEGTVIGESISTVGRRARVLQRWNV